MKRQLDLIDHEPIETKEIPRPCEARHRKTARDTAKTEDALAMPKLQLRLVG